MREHQLSQNRGVAIGIACDARGEQSCTERPSSRRMVLRSDFNWAEFGWWRTCCGGTANLPERRGNGPIEGCPA